jgi:hypothetical protein
MREFISLYELQISLYARTHTRSLTGDLQTVIIIFRTSVRKTTNDDFDGRARARERLRRSVTFLRRAALDG